MFQIIIIILLFNFNFIITLNINQKFIGLSNSTKPQQLKPNEKLVSGDQFGEVVTLWEDICLVSATKRAIFQSSSSSSSSSSNNNNNNDVHADIDGIVYVFQRNDNTREWKDTGVTLASTIAEDGFGESLSLYKDTAIVGAPRDDTYGINSGLVYVYYTTTSSSGENLFGNYQSLHSEQQREYDYFGYSVAVVPGVSYYSYGTVVIGAYGHDWDGRMIDSGAVFVFANSGTTWYQVTMIQPSQPYMNGYFGWSISAYDNAVLIGAPGQESAFLFHLEGVRTECPHEGPPDQMPESCQHIRKLQGQPGQDPGHHTYSVWKYIEILHVQNPLDTNKGEKFGTSVAVINETILTVVIGSPYDNSLGTGAGSVVILSQLPVNDLWESWTPGTSNYNNNNNNNNHPMNIDIKFNQNDQNNNIHRNLQKQNQPEMNDPRMNIWKIRSNTYTTDKDGSYWMLFKKTYGRYQNERYGQSVAISDKHILIGTNPGNTRRGRAEILVFNSTTKTMTDRPIYKGSLFMKDWMKQGDLFDYYGRPGDYFGYTVDLYEETAIIGGFLTGYQSEWNIGTGGAYIYDAIQIISQSDQTSSSSTSSSSSSLSTVNPFYRVGIYSLVIILIFVAFGGLFVTLSSNLPFFKLNRIIEKDMDTSTGSIDLGDVTSSHPLNSSSRKQLPSHLKYGEDFNRGRSSLNNNNNNKYGNININNNNNNNNNNKYYNNNNNNNNNKYNRYNSNNDNNFDEESQPQSIHQDRTPTTSTTSFSTSYPDNSRRGRTSQYFNRNQQGSEQNQHYGGRTNNNNNNNNNDNDYNDNNDNNSLNNNNHSNRNIIQPNNQQSNRSFLNSQPTPINSNPPPSKYSNLATTSNSPTNINPHPSSSSYNSQSSQQQSRTRTFQY